MFIGSRSFLLDFAKNSSKLWKILENGRMVRIMYVLGIFLIWYLVVKYYSDLKNFLLPTGWTTGRWLRSRTNERHSYESSWPGTTMVGIPESVCEASSGSCFHRLSTRCKLRTYFLRISAEGLWTHIFWELYFWLTIMINYNLPSASEIVDEFCGSL